MNLSVESYNCWKNNYSVKLTTVQALLSEHAFLSFVGDYTLSAIIIVRN